MQADRVHAVCLLVSQQAEKLDVIWRSGLLTLVIIYQNVTRAKFLAEVQLAQYKPRLRIVGFGSGPARLAVDVPCSREVLAEAKKDTPLLAEITE